MSVDPALFEEIQRESSVAWREFSNSLEGAFHHFLPADYGLVLESLVELRSRADSFLELGSGVGTVTILADLVGFQATGIEIEPELVRLSYALAEQFDSRAEFVEGSFVPVEFRDEIALQDPDFPAVTDGIDAFEELGMEISDFDLVYAYPWPGEEEWMMELVRRFSGPQTLFLAYRGEEGIRTYQ